MTFLPDVPDNFQPTYLDLILAALAAIAMPVVAGLLFSVTGALIPLLLYYGVFCWAIVRWRRGAVGYEINRGQLRKQFAGYVSIVFVIVLSLQLVLSGIELITAQQVSDFNLLGFIVTLVVWAPINAFSEQLIWVYTFDSYAEFFKEGPKRSGMIALGGLLYVILIGIIHALFWGLFLTTEGQYVFPFSELFIPIQMAISIGYIFLYRKAKSMWPLALIHVLINISAVLLSGYSILPFLLVFG
ncbi:MAG: hypothetical protein P1Q69_04260 [Candidatus Thorarchaeota archaeon]|nr:hypothetical protein [Candidatus Thorarchaeota archaeon]